MIEILFQCFHIKANTEDTIQVPIIHDRNSIPTHPPARPNTPGPASQIQAPTTPEIIIPIPNRLIYNIGNIIEGNNERLSNPIEIADVGFPTGNEREINESQANLMEATDVDLQTQNEREEERRAVEIQDVCLESVEIENEVAKLTKFYPSRTRLNSCQSTVASEYELRDRDPRAYSETSLLPEYDLIVRDYAHSTSFDVRIGLSDTDDTPKSNESPQLFSLSQPIPSAEEGVGENGEIASSSGADHVSTSARASPYHRPQPHMPRFGTLGFLELTPTIYEHDCNGSSTGANSETAVTSSPARSRESSSDSSYRQTFDMSQSQEAVAAVPAGNWAPDLEIISERSSTSSSRPSTPIDLMSIFLHRLPRRTVSE